MALQESGQQLLFAAAKAASNALATDLVAVDVTGTLPFSDAFLILTADNPRHLRGVLGAVAKEVRDEQERTPLHTEGAQGAEWMLVDYGDVVIHAFLPEARQFYALDKLWGRAPRISLPASDSE